MAGNTQLQSWKGGLLLPQAGFVHYFLILAFQCSNTFTWHKIRKGQQSIQGKLPFRLAPGHQILSLEAASVTVIECPLRGVLCILQTKIQRALLREGSTLYPLLFVSVYNSSLSIHKSFLSVFYNIPLSGCTLMHLARVLLMDMSDV